ncbi:MAG: glucose-1-phosphate cytidylyltransferase [Gemmatimonadaceae bacterium]
MRVVILAGGRGTRLAEETGTRPKPMVEIGGRPILWHLMRYYAGHGYRDFVVACGYKGDQIKSYFNEIALHDSDFFVNLKAGTVDIVQGTRLDWSVGLVDTGLDTMTGGRVRRLQRFLTNGTFMLTYGDGLSDVDIGELVRFHRSHGKMATVTAVRPPARFGALTLDADRVSAFIEKKQADAGWINGGFFVFEPGIFDYLGGDDTILENEPLERLAADGQLMAFRHQGFFQPMDTLRERDVLESLWAQGRAPWKNWT